MCLLLIIYFIIVIIINIISFMSLRPVDLCPAPPSGFDAEDDLHPGLLPTMQFHSADHRPSCHPRCQFGL